MTEAVERRSATIYVFPPRGRFAAALRDGQSAQTPKTVQPLNAVRSSYGEAWYQDEPVRETGERSGNKT
jgi:hypothetical protein